MKSSSVEPNDGEICCVLLFFSVFSSLIWTHVNVA